MSFRRKPESRHADISGNFTGGVTPVPIPNTEVKPTEVDGTIVTRLWESRTLPVYFKCPVIGRLRGIFMYQLFLFKSNTPLRKIGWKYWKDQTR